MASIPHVCMFDSINALTGVWVAKIRPPTDFMNDPAMNGVYRDPNQTFPFSKEYRDDPKTTRRMQEQVEIFTDRLRTTLEV